MKADTSAPVVSVRKVSKQFSNGTLAVRDVDLDLRQGEFVSLLGPSGCGKSTLLRMIAGLGDVSAGEIVWPLSVNKAVTGHGFELGFVFQEPTLMPWSTALSNVVMPLTLKGLPTAEAKERAASMLASVGLAGFENAYPRELSGGMKMRVSIARGLVTEPRILLMDEPFASLDALTRRKMQDELLQLWDDTHFTVLFVTHSIEEAIRIGTRILLLSPHPGEVKAELNSVPAEEMGTGTQAALETRINDMLFAHH